MQNVTIPGLPVLIHPQSNRPLTGIETRETKTWTFPLNQIAVKITKCAKLWDKSMQFLKISELFPIF